MASERSGLTRELVLLLALSTLWGASYSFIKVGVETIPPVTLIAARTFIAGAVLSPSSGGEACGFQRIR